MKKVVKNIYVCLVEEDGNCLLRASVPGTIANILRSSKASEEEKLDAVIESDWGKKYGYQACRIVNPSVEGDEMNECVERMARNIGKKILEKE